MTLAYVRSFTHDSGITGPKPDVPAIIVNWHHSHFFEVTFMHSFDIPEAMKLTKVTHCPTLAASCTLAHCQILGLYSNCTVLAVCHLR